MATKRNNAANGDVIVERVLTSDAFLAREIKKPLSKRKTVHLQPTSSTCPTTSKSPSKALASII